MSRRRYVSTTISTDRDVASLTDFEALLYTWMIPHAEDNATLTGDPGELLWTVIPSRRHHDEADILDALEAMESVDLVRVVDGVVYFNTESFYRYQSNIPVDKRADHSRLFSCKSAPAKNSEERRETARTADDARGPAGNGALPSPLPTPSPSPSENPLATASPALEVVDPIDDEFAVWWGVYGRVGSRIHAATLYRWWRTIGGASAEELLRAAEAYIAHCTATDCKVQHGRTFLAKKPCAWREWADGEAHGTMDVAGSARLRDVIEAGALIYGRGVDERGIGSTAVAGIGPGHGAGDVEAGPPFGGGVPEGVVATGQ